MKSKLFIVLLWALNLLPHGASAQALNWRAPDDFKHIVNANFGLDFGVNYGLAYGYKLRTKLPVVLTANFSMPAGATVLDDYKAKIGVQFCLLKKASFVGSVSVFGLYRNHKTELLNLRNLGSALQGSFGYYKQGWFVATEFGFDRAMATHFKHSQKFKEEIYADVVDGWYTSGTGGNVNYGLQGGRSFEKVDLTINLGKVVAQDFKTLPLLPFYLNVGVNYRLVK